MGKNHCFVFFFVKREAASPPASNKDFVKPVCPRTSLRSPERAAVPGPHSHKRSPVRPGAWGFWTEDSGPRKRKREMEAGGAQALPPFLPTAHTREKRGLCYYFGPRGGVAFPFPLLMLILKFPPFYFRSDTVSP